ncbi:MAG: shikimate dehydrogenase [Verrucomicrobiota bacterium]
MSEVWHMDDLDQSGAILAVLGFPVKHSLSPEMHQRALDEAGIAGRYVRFEVESGQIVAAFDRMRTLGFIGCNVTVPHKLEALAACDEVSAEAREIGAVNTIHFRDGKIIGSNTDGPGLANAVCESFGKSLGELKAVILGAGGGAGRAIAVTCALHGCPEILLVNRSLEKLGPIAGQLETISPGTRVSTLAFSSDRLGGEIRQCDLIIQATSLGMNEDDPPVLPEDVLRAGQFVYDGIYQPPETAFLRSAKAAGCQTANGLAMLLHQGALAFQTWFPGTRPLAAMRAALAQRF